MKLPSEGMTLFICCSKLLRGHADQALPLTEKSTITWELLELSLKTYNKVVYHYDVWNMSQTLEK